MYNRIEIYEAGQINPRLSRLQININRNNRLYLQFQTGTTGRPPVISRQQQFKAINMKSIWIIFGFLLAGTGFMALILSMVGVQLSFLTFIDLPGPLFGFVTRLLMIIAGFVIVFMHTTRWREE